MTLKNCSLKVGDIVTYCYPNNAVDWEKAKYKFQIIQEVGNAFRLIGLQDIKMKLTDSCIKFQKGHVFQLERFKLKKYNNKQYQPEWL